MTSETSITITLDFQKTVEDALKHYNEAKWLGYNSRLAAPYLLGQQLSRGKGTLLPNAEERGRLLQRILRETAHTLPAQTDLEQREKEILRLRYLTQTPMAVGGNEGLLQWLNITRNTYNLSKNAAIKRMAEALIRRLSPALRLETVPQPQHVHGRQAEVDAIIAWLQQRQSVALVGPSGVGKTTLARSVIHTMGVVQPFWLTFRAGFNDRLPTIIFYLAHYLQRHGQPALLAQLLADQSELKDYPATFGLLATGLEAISSQLSLLCFDEVDQIQPQAREAHEQIVKFLQDLQTIVPLLISGVTLPLLTPHTISLGGLSLTGIATYLETEQVPIDQDNLESIHQNTDGIPLLLDLFIAYYRSLQRHSPQLDSTAHGENKGIAVTTNDASLIQVALNSFATERSVEVWVNRVIRQLPPQEIYVLKLLATFRNPVPTDIQPTAGTQQMFREWFHWHLLQNDANGGVELLPALRQALYTQLHVEEKEQLHFRAAQIRANYGQYTAAAYHYLHAGEAEIAVSLWVQHHQMEIEQGQAGAALAILSAISERQLSRPVADLLRLHRAELNRLLGNYEPALTDLTRDAWQSDTHLGEATRMAADIAELRGEMQQAIQGYYAAQQTLERQLSDLSRIHRDLGYGYLHQHQYAEAHAMVLRIRHDAANLEGFIHERQGQLQPARVAYEQALHDAEVGAYAYGTANAHMNLGCIYGWQGDALNAEIHLSQAITYFEQSDMLNKLGEGLINLAVAYLVSEAYTQALPYAERAITLFEQINVERGKAAAYQLMAEVQLGIGEVDAAERFANQARTIDNTTVQPDCLRVLGEIRLCQGKLEEAEQLIEQSLELLQANPYPILEAYSNWALSQVYQAQGKTDQAQSMARKAAGRFEAIGIAHQAVRHVYSRCSA